MNMILNFWPEGQFSGFSGSSAHAWGCGRWLSCRWGRFGAFAPSMSATWSIFLKYVHRRLILTLEDPSA